MTTPNLGLEHITEGQTNKETTASVAFDGLDNAMNTVLPLTITGDLVLTDGQFRGCQVLLLSGTPGASFVVTIPGGYSKAFCVVNNTDADASFEMEDAASDGQLVLTLATGIFHSDGTTLYAMGTGSGGGGSSSSLIVEDEGVTVGTPSRLNFTGAGVNASENSDGTVDVTIAGAGAGTSIVSVSTDTEITNAHLAGNVILEVNTAGTVSLFIEAGTTGTEPVTIVLIGSGTVLVVDASSVSLVSTSGASLSTQYAAMSLVPRGSDSFLLIGAEA